MTIELSTFVTMNWDYEACDMQQSS